MAIEETEFTDFDDFVAAVTGSPGVINNNTSNDMVYVYVKHLDDSGNVVNTKHGPYLSDEVMVNVDFALGIYTTANRQALLDIAYASGVWLTVKVSNS